MVAINPCGRGFCPVGARLFWNMPGITIQQAASMCGITSASLHRHAAHLGLDERWRKKNQLRIPLSKLKEAWLDESTPLDVLAARLGIYKRYFQKLAADKGWPPRRFGRKKKYVWPEDFDAMWAAGVSLREIALTAGALSLKGAANEVRRRGLPPRDHGGQKSVSLAEYRVRVRQEAYLKSLSRSAELEQQASKALWSLEIAV